MATAQRPEHCRWAKAMRRARATSCGVGSTLPSQRFHLDWALGSWGVSEQSKMEACSPNCAPSFHHNFDAMRRDYLIADISLGVAVASAGVAGWWFLSTPWFVRPSLACSMNTSGAFPDAMSCAIVAGTSCADI